MVTKLENLVNPEVMADMISAKIGKKIVVTPFAKIDNTLQGRPGDTITIPKYGYIGDASDVAEGAEITAAQMSTSTTTEIVKKAAKATELTDEAILSGYGDPVGEASAQLAKAIDAKIDEDAMAELYTAPLSYVAGGIISYDNIVNAIDKFEEEFNTEKVMFINPAQVTQLRKDGDFISADKYGTGTNVMMTGEIGRIANCRVVPSKKVTLHNAETAVAGVYTCTIAGTVASGDTISFAGVEVTLDGTSGASATAAATALKNAFSGNETYTVASSSGVVTITEKSGKEGSGTPTATITSAAGTVETATVTAGITGIAAHFVCPIVKITHDSETEADTAALTIFLKRDTNFEPDRDVQHRKTYFSVDKHYVVALTDESKVVLAKFNQKA
jgi:N4-gp56 family major capsid protein